MPPAAPRRWTLADVRALIDANPFNTPRYELVDGELLATVSPTPAHQRALRVLLIDLHRYLERTGIGETLPSPFNVELEPESLVWPDIFVMPPSEIPRIRAEDCARSLLLAAEVLSPSSEYGDRGPKRRLYQRQVPEYWIIDLESAVVERWSAGAEQPEFIRDRLEWMPAGATEPFVLALSEFFAECGASQQQMEDPKGVVRTDTIPLELLPDDRCIFVPMEIENPLRPRERQILPMVLVDEAAPVSWVPSDVLEALGIERGRTRQFERRDGTLLDRPMGMAYLWVAGRCTIDHLVFAEPGDRMVLGARSLSGLNLRMDLVTRQLEDAGPIPAAAAG